MLLNERIQGRKKRKKLYIEELKAKMLHCGKQLFTHHYKENLSCAEIVCSLYGSFSHFRKEFTKYYQYLFCIL